MGTSAKSADAPRMILHLLVGYTVGGVEKQLLNLLPGLRSIGYDGIVCALKGPDLLSERFREKGFRTIFLGGRGKWDVSVLLRLYLLLRQEKVDILHCYTSRANWAGALMGRMAGVPVIVLSDREIRTWMRPWHRWLDRQCFRLARGMVVPARAIRTFDEDCLGLTRERIWVVPNGVDVSAFRVSDPKEVIRRDLGLDPGVSLLGYVGRLDESVKGIRHLLQALVQLKSDGANLHLIVVGKGPSERELRARVGLLSLESKVTFLGSRADIPRVMKALDLLVLPSVVEGCPNVVLEAMASGIPVVATDVGGIPELIKHGETGWLVPPADPMALARGISLVLGNPLRARSMARKGQDWVKRHRSIDRTVMELTHVYDRLMNCSAPPSGGLGDLF